MQLDPATQRRLIEDLAQRIQTLGLIGPALFFLESNRPIAFLGSQMLHFFQPLLGFTTGERLAQYAALFESDPAVESLIDRLEELAEAAGHPSGQSDQPGQPGGAL